MKTIFIAANWKSNNTIQETKNWLETFAQQYNKHSHIHSSIHIILFVPFTDLYYVKTVRDSLQLPFQIGAQDLSPYPQGPYTGEINAHMIKELADWALIGHTERRTLMNETEKELHYEILQAQSSNISILYCVSSVQDAIPPGVSMVAFEPKEAIGTGNPLEPKIINSYAETIKNKANVEFVLYGGSVTDKTAQQIINQPAVDGVLLGKASLDPILFFSLLKNIHAIKNNF